MAKENPLMGQSQEELRALCQDLSREMFDLRNEMSTSRKVEKPHLLRMKKKERARAMTILRQKEMNAIA